MPSSATGLDNARSGSSNDARALPSRAESTHIESRPIHPSHLDVESTFSVAFRDFLRKKRAGMVADQGTQTQMMCLPRQSRSRMEQMAQPGIWAEHGAMSRMTVYELKTISKDYGLGTSGTKTDLIARLRYYLSTDTG